MACRAPSDSLLATSPVALPEASCCEACAPITAAPEPSRHIAVDAMPLRPLLVARPVDDPPTASSTTPFDIYVDFGGSPPGNGTMAKPFVDWAPVVALLPDQGSGLPGPTVYLAGRTTKTLTLTRKGGTAYAPIRITQWPDPKAWLVIDGLQPWNDSSAWPLALSLDAKGQPIGAISAGIRLDGCEHVVIDGVNRRRFMIGGIAGAGIVARETSHLEIRNLTVEWTARSGLIFENDGNRTCPDVDLLVEGCRIDHANLGLVALNATECDALDQGEEAISIANYDGFEVRCCEVSNSLASGIAFKAGSLHGSVHHNVVEMARVFGIAAEEGCLAEVYMNVVRYIGYHTVQKPNASDGIVTAAPWLARQLRLRLTLDADQSLTQDCLGPSRSAGILVANGDLGCRGETGTASNLRIYQNEVYWTLGASIAVKNLWRLWKKSGVQYRCAPRAPGDWPPDSGKIFDIEIAHNVCYRAQQGLSMDAGLSSGDAAIELDGEMLSSQVKNNMIVGTDPAALAGLAITDWQGTTWATEIQIANNYWFDGRPTWKGHAIPYGAIGRSPVLGSSDPFVRVPQRPGEDGDFLLKPGDPARRAGTPAVYYAPGYDAGAPTTGSIVKPSWRRRYPPDLGAHPAMDLGVSPIDWKAGTACSGLRCIPTMQPEPPDEEAIPGRTAMAQAGRPIAARRGGPEQAGTTLSSPKQPLRVERMTGLRQPAQT